MVNKAMKLFHVHFRGKDFYANEHAAGLIDAVAAHLREAGLDVQTGRFGAAMAVESVNDGPFTVIVET